MSNIGIIKAMLINNLLVGLPIPMKVKGAKAKKNRYLELRISSELSINAPEYIEIAISNIFTKSILFFLNAFI